MRRNVVKGSVATVLMVFAMAGEAAAFTPVPIPIPRSGHAAVAQVVHVQARPI